MKPGQFTVKSGIEVEYAQVRIGGKDYFLPVRSVTSSLAHHLLVLGGGTSCSYLSVSPSLQTSLNDVDFKDFHVFRSDASIVTDSEAAELTGQPTPTPNSDSSKQSVEADTAALSTANSAEQLPPANVQADSTVSSAANAPNPPAQESQPATKPAPDGEEPAIPQPVSTMQPSNQPPTPEPAASTSSDIPSTPVIRATARQVLVDVVVDKKNGTPVSGLPQSDFSVEEDGKPQTIDFFEEHSAAAPTPVAAPAMPPLPPGAVTNVPTAPPSSVLYVFLLDSLNTEPQDQQFVRQQILSFLHKLDPGTQVAVFSLGSQLRLLQGFTSDPTALLAAVSGNEAERDAMAQTRSDNADEAQHMANLAAMQSAVPSLQKYSRAETPQAYSFGTRAAMTFEALNALARYLESMPGRKNLIWFAGSFPVSIFPTPSQMKQFKSNPGLSGYVNHVRQTANLFTLSRIAVYPVSSAGVMNSNIGMADSADAGSAGGTGHFGTAAGPTASLTAEAMNSGSAVAGMEQLAASTGGRAFTTNDIDAALHHIIHDSDIYYTVGYAPSTPAADGAFRRINVKVTGGKYKLAYRQGYNAVSASAESAPAQDPIAPLLRLGLPSATGIFYGATIAIAPAPDDKSASEQSASAGQNEDLKGPLTRYAVSLNVRAQDISFIQTPNGTRVAKLLIGVKAYGRNGAALNWQANRQVAQLTPEQYASILKNGLPIKLDIDLPANTPAQIVTAVYDWDTSRSGSLEIPVHP